MKAVVFLLALGFIFLTLVSLVELDEFYMEDRDEDWDKTCW
jgi:hypothetical protein